MKNILFFGLGYCFGGLLVGYSLVYFMKRSCLVYDRNCRADVSSTC